MSKVLLSIERGKMNRSFLLIFCVLAILTGCSSSNRANLSSGESALLSSDIEIDLLSARGFLGGSDYERYHFKDDVLWRECGSLADPARKHRQASRIEGDDMLAPDPTLVVEERRVDILSQEQALALRNQANLLARKRANNLPLPGSVYSLAQPGLFELSITVNNTTQRILTSVDAVSEPENSVLKAALRLAEKLRGVGPVICNAPTFFGIARNESND